MLWTYAIWLRAVVLAASLLLAAPAAVSQSPPPAPAAAGIKAAPAPEEYSYSYAFPVEIPGLGFEMPKQAFLDILAAKKLTPVTNTAKTMFLVQPSGAPYGSMVYFFDSNAGEILTEMELRFADTERAKAYFDARFPEFTRIGGQYLKSDGIHGYAVKAWCFGPKVFIVATMANTRWAS